MDEIRLYKILIAMSSSSTALTISELYTNVNPGMRLNLSNTAYSFIFVGTNFFWIKEYLHVRGY